ncbi:Uncharacterised protein [Vibrio cholerae]|nr:Uncharacterised protein [Vibrio cholerae]
MIINALFHDLTLKIGQLLIHVLHQNIVSRVK